MSQQNEIASNSDSHNELSVSLQENLKLLSECLDFFDAQLQIKVSDEILIQTIQLHAMRVAILVNDEISLLGLSATTNKSDIALVIRTLYDTISRGRIAEQLREKYPEQHECLLYLSVQIAQELSRN